MQRVFLIGSMVVAFTAPQASAGQYAMPIRPAKVISTNGEKSGSAPNPAPTSLAPRPAIAMGARDARHLLARVSPGAKLAEIDAFAVLTRQDAVTRLIEGVRTEARTPPPAWTSEPILPLRTLRDASTEQRAAFQREQVQRGFELRGWWITEMLTTDSPLTERMALFWHNHFTSSQQKVRYAQLMYRQNQLLRRHALGNFADLLHAVSRDPAMILYLDSASNRRDRPNENFAREVMELFTLGEGHYTETDVKEAARAFTGWSIDPDTGDFRWRPMIHDGGEKSVLGRRGRFDGDDVLDLLLAEPRTAIYLVGKLWREFVSPDANVAEIERIADLLRDSRYDVRVALRAVLMSDAFWSEANRGVLVKSPVDFVIGTLRQFDVQVTDATPFALITAGLGQNLFSPPNVKGWPGGEAWINSATLLARRQFVERLFRADEMRLPPKRGEDTTSGAVSGFANGELNGGEAAVAAHRSRLRRSADEMRLDANQWLQRFAARGGATHGDARSRQTFGIDDFVLATGAVYVVPASISGRERLRQLTLDPGYQLK